MSMLNKVYFQNEKAAFSHLEKLLWDEGVICPHCGLIDRAGRLDGVKGKTGKVRLGLWKCYECRKQFTCTVGTVFESRHIPLHKMLQAVYLMSSSKKGCSAHQLHRTLGITYKSAWFLAHRIREAMRDGKLAPMGGAGSVVEIDETLFGFQFGANTKTSRTAGQFRNVIMTLVTREGSARSFHVAGMTHAEILPIIRTNIRRETAVMTDEAIWYKTLGNTFASHDAVNHSKFEYVRGEVTTNTVEGYFSIFKRGMKGVYQHCAEKHLHRYLAEFDFRYNHRVRLGYSDDARTTQALRGIVGKRLTYRNPDESRSATA